MDETEQQAAAKLTKLQGAMGLTDRSIEAARGTLEIANVQPSDANVVKYINRKIITFASDAQGTYCWYIDDKGLEICVNIETLQEMDLEDDFGDGF